ncbi:MAG: TatD family hydrolase [bacterium]|nr:TatD family hydrolase [bacterium]
MSSIFDSHCHPQMAQYDKDRDEMIRRALDAKVSMICVGTDLETSKQGIELAQKHNNMWASVGLHPNDNLNEKFNPSEYEELLKMPKVVAMGEIGLDYYRTTEPKDQDFQKKRFEEQLNLAVRMNMPVILHSRDAGKGSTGKVHENMIAILQNNLPSKLGVAHSFTGTINDAKKYLDLGFYVGFNGILTFARQYDEVVRYAPLEQILLETDAPYLTPEPYRTRPPAFAERFGGRVRNEPAYVVEVAKKVAELKNIPIEKVIDQTTTNCTKLFGTEASALQKII